MEGGVDGLWEGIEVETGADAAYGLGVISTVDRPQLGSYAG